MKSDNFEITEDEKEFLELYELTSEVNRALDCESALTVKRGLRSCELTFKIQGDTLKAIGQNLGDASYTLKQTIKKYLKQNA